MSCFRESQRPTCRGFPLLEALPIKSCAMSAFPNHFLRFSLFLLLSIGCVASAAAQSSAEQETYETQKRLTVGVTKFAEARAAVAGFIRGRAVRVQKQEETPDQITAEFVLPTTALPRLDSLVATLGFVLENNLNARNLATRLQELATDEQELTAQLNYSQIRLRTASLSPSEQEALAAETVRQQTRLARVRQQQQELQSHQGQAYVLLLSCVIPAWSA